ncbi:hypothetical protein BDW59DRAFT_146997 [Aspergillus cavernicola]|uniref:Clr5 domain-containing protein n=1 Tax=Aspergillus cavernicola TaxID=176166 RepID=A0ABR4IAH7_9EURO
MKNSVPIPSDVWEEKKALIAALYKDEEWPLKQVIKKIRSDNFNPSETQLRSRLKKWRVTKPSRQTRKKSEETTRDTIREANSPKRHCNNTSPRTQTRTRPVPTATRVPATEPEWYMTNGAYEPHGLPTTIPLGGHDIPTVWAPTSSHSSPLGSPNKSRVNSHASLAISTSSYDPSQSSPLMDGALLNPTPAMTPTYTDHYPLNADPCIATPMSSTTAVPPVQWAIPQWYSMPMEASTRAPSMPFYSTGPLTPPIDPMMHMMHPQHPQQMSDFHEGLKTWKRTMSVPYSSDVTAQMNQKLRQPPKPLDRKVSLPPKISTGQLSSGVMTPTSPYFPHGQHPTMCSPDYTYPGPEHLVHHRSSIDF